MALSPQLLNFKSSGVYRLEFDKSQTTNVTVETIRLVVGHSKKGPYNTPVFIRTAEEFTTLFGNIDTNLEKIGMFFHRSALAALGRGPILALNVANVDANDTIEWQAPVTNGSIDSINSLGGSNDYASYFNVDKFWFPEDKATLDTIGIDDDRILNFINIKQEPITVIVRKAQDVVPFEITAREWYGEGNVPSFLNDFDYVSDFMVDVFVFKGEFNPAQMDTDPVYGAYFNADGLLKNKLDEFSALRQVTLLAKYTGSLIPGFRDLEGRNLYIEAGINQEARRTGLFCAVNEDLVTYETGTKVDLVGHVYDESENYELLSYIAEYVQTTVVSYNPTQVAVATASLVNGNVLTIYGEDLTGDLAVGKDLARSTSGQYAQILNSVYNGTDTVVSVHPSITLASSYTLASPGNINVYDEVYTPAYAHAKAKDLVGGTYANLGGGVFTMAYNTSAAADAFPIKKGHYVDSAVVGRLAKVKRVQRTANTWTVTCDREVAATWSGFYNVSFEEATTVYKPFVLGKANIAAKTIAGVLGQLSGTGLFNALIDKDVIDYRYIVDTFASYENGSILTKKELSYLAHERQNAAAILNAPTVKDFKNSTDPSFKNDNNEFDVIYIKDGGNLDKNPSALYALPSINEGANYAFYYAPGLLVRENGKDVIVPPAAYVSNNFIDKYFNALPWSIVAGPRRGVVTGANVVGVEYAFDKADRDILEPFGINPIVFQRGAGLTILGNKTAQQSIKSALSSAHVREVLIYIQEGMAKILKDYVFEFNTAQTRLEIKTLADSFMQSVKADSGIYDFKNVMDQTNNTDDVIDNNMGIIDTFVEPVKGLEIVVHRTTVLNTGEIATGNFS
jgi:hypothetical protein